MNAQDQVDGIQVFTYAMLNRPAWAASPAGGNSPERNEFNGESFTFGIVQYTRPLTPKEVYDYEMALLDPLPDLPLYPEGTNVRTFNSGKVFSLELFDGEWWAGDLELPTARTWRSVKRWMMFEPVVIPSQPTPHETYYQQVVAGLKQTGLYTDEMLHADQATLTALSKHHGISQVIADDQRTPVETHPDITSEPAPIRYKVEVYFGFQDHTWLTQVDVLEFSEAELAALPNPKTEQGDFGRRLYEIANEDIDQVLVGEECGEIAFSGLYAYRLIDADEDGNEMDTP